MRNTRNLNVIKLILKAFLWTLLFYVLTLFTQCSYEISYQMLFGKASYSTEAVYELPGKNIEIILERRCIHLFLAEYERTLVLRVGGKEVLRQKAADDSGGYCRMSIYKVTPNEYFLSGELEFDRYELNIAEQKIILDYPQEKPRNAEFVGVFDNDEEKDWRFISATEREEQKSKIQVYGEK